MIKNIIFDFGDVFINLDKEAIFRSLVQNGIETVPSEGIDKLNNAFEVGALSIDEFIEKWQELLPSLTKNQVITIWNSILSDFPDTRLEFIEQLAAKNDYRLFLLSNTNALHIAEVTRTMGTKKYNRFKNAFDQFYLSHEIGMRKPNTEIYDFVLKNNTLKAEETLFVDDNSDNTKAAATLGIFVWNLKVGQEDILQLNKKL